MNDFLVYCGMLLAKLAKYTGLALIGSVGAWQLEWQDKPLDSVLILVFACACLNWLVMQITQGD